MKLDFLDIAKLVFAIVLLISYLFFEHIHLVENMIIPMAIGFMIGSTIADVVEKVSH